MKYIVRDQSVRGLLGLIQRPYYRVGQNDRVALIDATFTQLLLEIRKGGAWIFLIQSERYSDGFEISEPPLRVHFSSPDKNGEVHILDVDQIQVI